jgi:hypothetical protein
MLCDHGNNTFRFDSSSGVSVLVGPSHAERFAARQCAAELVWHKQRLAVADQVPQVDLDLFDVEIGAASPVAAFQVKPSEESCCLNYQIYTLRSSPRLLRTLRGGFFSAADTNLDGRVEIWAEDAEAVDGLDGLSATTFDFLPTYVLRFEGDRLLDATQEFASHFDAIISGLRAKLTWAQLEDFKSTDGKLALSITNLERFRSLHSTKMAVLEMVWSYLYSGREEEAWKALREMWPPSDFERMQAAIADRRKRGILTQIDGLVPRPAPAKARPVYSQSQVTPASAMNPSFPDLGPWVPTAVDLDLVIDSAGKVHYLRPGTDLDPYLLAYARAWKFVPATRGGHSVASHLHLSLSLKR